MASETSSEQSASPSQAHKCSGQRRASSLHSVLRESTPTSVSPAFSGFMDDSVSVPELMNWLRHRVDSTRVKSSFQQPGTVSPRAAREHVTVAEIHAIPHSLQSPVQVDSPPTVSQAPHSVPTDFPADTVHLLQPRNYFPPSTSSDEEGWTRVPSLWIVTHDGVILRALQRSQVQHSMWIPVENIILREVMGEVGVSYIFKWESSAQLPQFPFPQVTTEEVSKAAAELALLSQLPTPTLHQCATAPRSNHFLSLPSVEDR
ncbi:hypothetical protein Pcinc_003502 [Petrolisthes cinctipes]|uniref:Uncharacterized protein n=1 Tax=Petrolisthes cinctipes TaxID=88211 RepID=A0AAE1GHA6_PETCI|nr:hypothetical protein Pcinc_003502 [Petrolisthes cinctipes]